MAIIAVLLYSLLRLRRRDYNALSDHMASRSRDSLRLLKPCPICGTLLSRGERVHTVVFSGEPAGRRRRDAERTKDALVHMFGCPYCHPPNARYPRVCPVCHEQIPDDGFVVARMFIKNDRKHVHVLGCTTCRPSAAGQHSRRSS